MPERDLLGNASPALRLAIATSWLAPDDWRASQEERIRAAMNAGPDWTEYLALVNRHDISGLSWASLGRVQGASAPELVRQQLQRRGEACRIQGLRLSLALANVLKELDRAAIGAMPLKGPALSYELYGDAALRVSDDLDLQIQREDLHRAIGCLESTGWRAGSDLQAMSSRQWESFLRHEHDVQLSHSRSGCSLELHWRNHWESLEDARDRWARSGAAVWQGCSVRQMSGGDLALFLCTHGAHHVWCCAKWLSDVARAHSIGRLDWGAAMDEAREGGLEGVLSAAQFLLRNLYGLDVPDGLGAADGAEAHPLPLLLKMPIESLMAFEDPRAQIGMAQLRYHAQMMRYERLARPRTSWGESLSKWFYCQQDYRILPLPDSLFWLYKPLRPILWLRRWAVQAWVQAFGRRQLRASL